MNANFVALIERVRSALGMKRGRRGEARRLEGFRPDVEALEDRITPSTATPQSLAVYQALTVMADHIAIELVGAAQSALANSQTIQQAIGSAFLQGVITQMETDLAPLITINFGGTPAGGLFGATTDAQFAQKCSAFLRACIHAKIFARCTTQAATDNASISSNICRPAQLANVPGAVTYGTTCVRICDEIFICQLSPSVSELCTDIYDAAPCVLQNEPLDIQNGIDQGDTLVPPVFQNGEQQIEGFIADPNSVTVTQTPSLQFDRADASLASSTTLTLSAAGVAESSATALFDPTGTAVQENNQANYAATGLVVSQSATLFNADASTNSTYDSVNLTDGSSATIQTVFGANQLVVNQELTVYNAAGSVAVSVNTTNVEASDQSLATTQGIVTVASGARSNTYTLANIESAGTPSSSTTSMSDSGGFEENSATATYGPTSHVTSVSSTNFDHGAVTGSTVVDGNGDPVITGTGGGGGGGGTGGGGGGGGGGGFTGGGGTGGGGGFTGGGGTGGGGGGGGFTGGGGTSGGTVGGGGGTGGGGGSGSGGGGDFVAAARTAGVFVPAGNMTLARNASLASAATASGPPFAGIVGTFSDTDANPADYSAIISWGDGTGSAGIVSALGNGKFDVFGTHPTAPEITDRLFVSVTNVKTGEQLFAAQPAALPFNDTFNNLSLSDSWSTRSGTFLVVNNQATALGFNTPNVAVLKGISAADVSASVGVTSLLTGQTAALVARYQDTAGGADFYYGGITRTGLSYSAVIYKSIDGVSTPLASTPIPASQFSGTGAFQFEAEGSSLRVIVNQGSSPVLVAQVSDTSITTPGTVGLWGSTDAQFSNYSVNAVNATTPSLSPSFTDSFGPTSDGQLSSNWISQSGDFARNASGNLAGFNSTVANVATLNGINQANVSVQAQINVPVGQYAGLVTRYQGTADQNMYFGEIKSNGAGYVAQIYVNNNGVWTPLTAAISIGNVGQGTLLFTTIGSSLQLFWQPTGTNGFKLVASAANSSLTDGSVGIRASSTVTLANFAATVATPQNAALPFSETFSAANYPSNLGAQLSTYWQNQVGDMAIVNGNAAGQATCNVATLNGINQANVSVQAVVNVPAGQFAGLVTRYQGTGDQNMYFGMIISSGSGYVAQIFVNKNGSWTSLAASSIGTVGQGTLLFTTIGSSLQLFWQPTGTNGFKLVASASDSSLNSGSVGLRVGQGTTLGSFTATMATSQNATLPFSENFSAANYPSSPGSQLSSYWQDQVGDLSIINGNATGQAAYNVATLNGINQANVSVQAVVNVPAGQFAGLVTRYQGTGDQNMYFGMIISSGSGYVAQIFINKNGSWTPLASSLIGTVGQGTLLFTTIGSSLQLFWQASGTTGFKLVASATNSALTTGSVGLRVGQGVKLASFTANAATPQNATLPFNETFSAAGYPSTPGSQLSNNWQNQVGDMAIANGNAAGQTTYNVATLNGINQANVSVQAVVNVSAGQFAGLVTRYQGTGDQNMYFGMIISSGSGYVAQIFINKNGVWTSLASTSIGSVGHGTLLFKTIGTSLQLFWNGTLVVSTNDSRWTAGSVGLRVGQGAILAGFAATAS